MPPTNSSAARIRNRAKTHFLTDRCTIQYLVPGTGIVPGADNWQNAGEDVPCRIIQQEKPQQPESMLLGGQETIPEYYLLALPHDQVIEPDFRVLLAGEDYEVTRLETALTHKAFKQVVITRRTGAG